jgi:hypothetical protein
VALTATQQQLQEARERVARAAKSAGQREGWYRLIDLLPRLGSDDPTKTLRELGRAYPPLREVVEQKKYSMNPRAYSSIRPEHLDRLAEAIAIAPAALGPWNPGLPGHQPPPKKKRKRSRPKPKSNPAQLALCPALPPPPPQPALTDPFGWSWVGGTPVPRPEEQKILTQVRKLRRCLHTLEDVARTLNAGGCLLRGRPWRADEIDDVLERDDRLSGRDQPPDEADQDRPPAGGRKGRRPKRGRVALWGARSARRGGTRWWRR